MEHALGTAKLVYTAFTVATVAIAVILTGSSKAKAYVVGPDSAAAGQRPFWGRPQLAETCESLYIGFCGLFAIIGPSEILNFPFVKDAITKSFVYTFMLYASMVFIIGAFRFARTLAIGKRKHYLIYLLMTAERVEGVAHVMLSCARVQVQAVVFLFVPIAMIFVPIKLIDIYLIFDSFGVYCALCYMSVLYTACIVCIDRAKRGLLLSDAGYVLSSLAIFLLMFGREAGPEILQKCGL